MVAIAVICLVWFPMASAKDFLFRNTIQVLVKTIISGTWGIFSSYHGDAHSKREFV